MENRHGARWRVQARPKWSRVIATVPADDGGRPNVRFIAVAGGYLI
jgi:hypothetical protein